MDPLDFLEVEHLREFFRRHKTEMSCMDNAHVFLRQLRDHNLVPEDTFTKIRRMRSKDNMRKALYDVLDLLEKKESDYIKVFWKCVFRELILNQCPYLKELRNTLFDGSDRFSTQLPEKVEKEEAAGKKKLTHKDEESVTKKRKFQAKSLRKEVEEENQPGPSSSLSPKKKIKIRFKITEEVSPLPQQVAETDKGGETEAPQPTDGQVRQVFPVTCGEAVGKLHSRRFAAGTRSKSIRTQTSWLTPQEFVKGASSVDDPSWRRDILWEGKPLSDLIESGILRIHSLMCTCPLCCQDEKDQENQNNDDECCVCKGEEGEELVVCDYCPRSFHQKCHLPHIDDDNLSDEGQWSCTFCVYTKSQERRYPNENNKEETMSRRISQYMLECQYLLLYLFSADEIQLFATDPSLLVNDYTKVIKTPMWLGKVAERLQRNQYETVGQFVSDAQLIFTNCASYNKRNAELLSMGSRLKELFDKELQDVFKFH